MHYPHPPIVLPIALPIALPIVPPLALEGWSLPGVACAGRSVNAGLVARSILCYTRVGETLARGQRYGFIRFGSRVAIGEKVSASSTVPAWLD